MFGKKGNKERNSLDKTQSTSNSESNSNKNYKNLK